MVRRVDLRIVNVVSIEDIVIDERVRKTINRQKVDELAASIEKIGMQVPITLRYVPSPDGEGNDVYLVAGLHRIEAHKTLGREEIDCFFDEALDARKARLWEISENLHRSELDALEHAEHVDEWIRLTEEEAADDKLSQVVTVSKGGRGKESGVRAASRELGVGRMEAHRSVKIASLSDEAKEYARNHGLADNQAALIAAAKHENDPAAQVQSLSQRAKARGPRVVVLEDKVQKTIALIEKLKLTREEWQSVVDHFDRPVFDRGDA